MYDAIVVGGGFYGVVVAEYLAARRGFSSVAVIEREAGLLRRASSHNQARVHNGYHYPRSLTTAMRSRVNLPRFVRDFRDCVGGDYRKVYAIARRNSKVTARQFERFCAAIGAPLKPAPAALGALFDPLSVEAVYLAEEPTFDYARLAGRAERTLREAGIEAWLSTDAVAVNSRANGSVEVELQGRDGVERLTTRYVFNCTYSRLNHLGGSFPNTVTPLKHEIAELALVEMPPELRGVGITVMDGPFFSALPFPARGLHSLSHVRHTPHAHWADSPESDPHLRLAAHGTPTRATRMLRDAARYVPAIADARLVESFYEVKTVLAKNESDDGRPILFERHERCPECFSILGGKIDNIYDILERLDREVL
jgi:glycine/D-amino acid oxidase-like deaminating enzyme